jgi:hypothetical protein
MRRLVLILLSTLLLAACGATAAAPRPDGGDAEVGPSPSTTPPPAETPPVELVASSSASADHLAQLLTAPRPPAPKTTDAAGDPLPWPKPSGPPYTTGPRKDSPVVVPPPALPPGDGTVYAVGDSVLLGTQDYLPTTIGGWDLRFDAKVGRTFPEGIDIINENKASLGQAAIILLGHNYWGGGAVYSYLDQIMADMHDVERVVFVTVAEWSPAQPEVNRAIRALPKVYPNVVVADWEAVLEANPQFLVSDHVHLTRSGDIALANLIGVMLGPASPNGKTVPRPTILPIPEEGTPSAGTSTTTSLLGGSTTTTSPESSSTTTSTPTGSSTTTTAPPASTTTSTAPAVTTTTAAPATTTTAPSG